MKENLDYVKTNRRASVNLFYNYFKSQHTERNIEYAYCIKMAQSNKYIDNIYLLNSDTCEIVDQKVTHIDLHNKRPTYNDYFINVNLVTGEDDINIVLNSDCFIDELSVNLVADSLLHGEVYCLSRWDIVTIDPLVIKRLNDKGSHDAWIFKGKIKSGVNADYALGMPHCDHAIAYELKKNGYLPLNPSLDVKIIHYHLSNLRTYRNSVKIFNELKVREKYLLVSASNIGDKEDKSEIYYG